MFWRNVTIMTVELLHDPETEGPPRTPVDGVNVVGSLSPSRASDFMACPLLYRFRVIDQIPETPDPAAARGTLVHAVLERLFDLPAGERTLAEAATLLRPVWDELVAAEPEAAELFGDADQLAGWLDEARTLLETYFALEDPRCLEPAERELYVEHVLDSKLLVRGYVDRLDVNRAGQIRVVDYKTGRSPREIFEAKALFQMKFYALTIWRSRGVIPALLQLIYLGNGEILRYEPDEADLLATERKVNALWTAIARAMESGDWRPRKSALCDWCDHKSRCPEWGGTLPPLPEPSVTEPATAAAEPAVVADSVSPSA